MTTATAAPLTEAEIRAAIEDALDHSTIDIGQLIYSFLQPIDYIPEPERANCRPALWDNLRPSEAARLSELVERVYCDLEPEIERMIADAVVGAALAFAAEYPDAPRAIVEAGS